MIHSLITRGVIISLVGFILVVMVANAEAAPPIKGGSSGSSTQNWDTVLPTDQRFTVLAAFNNEAVRDNETGLVWERSPSSSLDYWAGSLSQCVNKVVGGRKGWRLPSVHELSSLIDPSISVPGPTLSSGHPFLSIVQESYWTAPTNLQRTSSAFAWIVNFGNGAVEQGLSASDGGVHYAWCVRGAAPMASSTH